MSPTIDFVKGMPDGSGEVIAIYFKTLGADETSVVDVFIDNMSKVDYTLTEGIVVTQKDNQLVVALLQKAIGQNVMLGLSIRKPTDPISNMPQIKKTFWDKSFKSWPTDL